MATLANLVVKLGLDDAMSGGLKGAADSVSKFGRNMTTYATVPILAAGVAAVKWGSDLNEAMSAANTVFGENGAAIIAWGDTTAATLGIAKSDALTAATQFATLGISAGLSGDELVTFSTRLVTAASDLSSFWNVPTSTVLADLQSGLVGQYEPLLKYGIQLNEATVSQRAMADTGKDNVEQLTAGEKTAARYKLILEGLGVAEGDRTRTAGEFAGQMRTLQAQFKDAAAVLGMQLLPALTNMVTKSNELIAGYQSLSPKQQKIIEGATVLVAIIGPMALAFGFIATNATAFGAALGLIIAPLTAATALLVILSPLLVPLGFALGVLKLAGVDLGAMFDRLKGTIASFKDIATSSIRTFAMLSTAALTLLKVDGSQAMADLKTNVLKSISDLAAGALAWLGVIEIYFSTAFENIKTEAGTKVGEMYANVILFISTLATDAYTESLLIGSNIGQGIIDGISSMWASVIGFAESLAQAVYDKIKAALSIKSPSKKTTFLGEMLGEGLILGMANAERKVANAAGSMTGAAMSGMSNYNGGINISVSGAGDPNAVADRVFARFTREMALSTGGV